LAKNKTYKYRVAFWLGTPVEFDPKHVKDVPLGGAEISAINLANALSKRNIHVTIYCNAKYMLLGENVKYRKYESLKNESNKIDFFICVRADSRVLNPIMSKEWLGSVEPEKVIVWTGDESSQPNNKIFNDPLALNLIDLICVKSFWQKNDLLKSFPLLKSKNVSVIRNGHAIKSDSLILDNFGRVPSIPVATKFVYASTAYRGLHNFLEIWPMIKSKISFATLDCYCKLSLYGKNVRDRFTPLYKKLNNLDGICIKEPMPQKDFLKILSSYDMMLYPNTDFNESSCGVALQSSFVGVPVITTARAGLVETVERICCGFVLPYDANDPDFAKNYAQYVVDLAGSVAARSLSISLAYSSFEKYTWKKISNQWIDIFNIMGESSALIGKESGTQVSQIA